MKLRIFLSIFVLTLSLPALAQNKTPQSLEQINAALKAKKAELEPFNDKDVKIDLESLGLDNLSLDNAEKKPAAPTTVDLTNTPAPAQPFDFGDKKPQAIPMLAKENIKEKEAAAPAVAAKNAPIAAPQKSNSSTLIVLEPKNPTPPPALPTVEAASKNADKPAESDKGFVKKIGTFLNKSVEEVKSTIAKDNVDEKPVAAATPTKVKAKTKTEKYINSAKKRDLKKRIEAEKKRRAYEKQRQQKTKKLQQLREQYLLKVKKDNSDKYADEDLQDEEEKILPQKKNLNPFVSDEPPALPLIDRFRTQDNLHIPLLLSDQERVGILFDAISSGSVAFFNSAYKDVGNPNTVNLNGDTILTYAILMQKYPVMAAVLARGADPNFPNALGYTPLDIAIETLDLRALTILIDNKADFNYVDSFGRTSLMHAARLGFLPAVELLVAKGVDVNTMDNDGFTALSIAYRHKKEVIVKFLLKRGAQTWIEKPYTPEKQSLIQELENRWK